VNAPHQFFCSVRIGAEALRSPLASASLTAVSNCHTLPRSFPVASPSGIATQHWRSSANAADTSANVIRLFVVRWLTSTQVAGQPRSSLLAKNGSLNATAGRDAAICEAERVQVFSAISPMPLLRVAEPFDHDEWIFELKLDGFRALAHIDGHHCGLVSRNGHTFNTGRI